MEKFTLYIDGNPIEATKGQTILEAALANDYYIPHLCTHPDLPTLGGCNLCVVEIEGMEGPVRACESPAREGIRVTSKSESLSHRRSVAMELMLAGHPHDCTSCKAYLKCELQAMMQYLGTVHSRLRTVHRQNTKINTNNPLIVREMERCIQCGRCVRACREMRGVDALSFNKLNDETYISTPGDLPLADAGCRFCGACVEVCPTGALQDEEGVFRTDVPREQALIPCQVECAAHIDIPAYLRYIKEGKYSEAVGVIREKVPFPHALGYVCNNLCETGCKRSKLNEPIAIRDMKRFAVEHDKEQIWKEKYLKTKPRTGKKIAVVGGGPAGLTAAFYLNKQGHDVTVFEKQKVPGGHMTGGMPEYRIPTKDVLAEIKLIEESGVKIICDHPITNVAELKKDYDAVVVAIGTSIGKKLTYLPGSDFDHVYTAVDLLRASRLGLPIELGETVNIIGGGNVAFDVARTLIRMGKKVNVVCLEKNASQASPEEVEEAIEEGVQIYDCHSNEAIIGTKEKVTGLQVHKINSFYFDPETRALVEDPIPDSTYVIPCDSIVFAAGQVTGLTEDFGLELNRFGYPINPATGKSDYITSIEGVFAVGDVITGTKFVINAIAGGREVASIVDKYLGGDGIIEETLVDRTREPVIGRIDDFSRMPRQKMAIKGPEERKSNFLPISEGLTVEQAHFEGSRCLQCDLRTDITKVRLWTEYAHK
jgi:NADPH-dependent glutamate synthase beta subunit-like oxidoreductase/Pyruvate/2-oxoacid:ferredoxin oxidoreductase delta subunit/ferredoxin